MTMVVNHNKFVYKIGLNYSTIKRSMTKISVRLQILINIPPMKLIQPSNPRTTKGLAFVTIRPFQS